MAASSSDVKHKKKRSREQPNFNISGEPAEKRRKEDVIASPKEEISIQTYFSLASLDLVNEGQVEEWEGFIKVLNQFLFPADISMDNSNPLVIHVPRRLSIILQEMNYSKLDLNELAAQLEEKQNRFVKILEQLRRSSKKSDQEREELFTQLKQFIKEGIVDLTLADSAGWNVLHIAVCYGRIDLLICIQHTLLPGLLEQYETLLSAKTNRAGAIPASMKKIAHSEDIFSLLSEKQLILLKEKQFAVILKMLVANGKETQCITLGELLKYLITEAIDLTVVEETRGLTILHHAVYKNDIDLVTHILQYASLEQCEKMISAKTNETGSTAFSIATYYHYEEILSLLNKKEALIAGLKEELAEIFKDLKRLKKITETDKSLLYERIKQFIKNGGDPTQTDDRGLNFLHYAACFDDINLMLFVKEYTTRQQYQKLLCTESKKMQLTPYGVVKNKKKDFENQEMLKLLNPEADQNTPQSYGQFTFFNPTLLADEPVPLRRSLSPKQ